MSMNDDTIPAVGASDSYPAIHSSDSHPPLSNKTQRKRSKARRGTEQSAQAERGKEQPEQEGHVDRYA
jgi:hypothetical protein